MAGQATDPVLYRVKGSAEWLTINRCDQRNALNDQVVEGLLACLERALLQDVVRSVVLTGKGNRAFCAGGDLTSTMSPEEVRVQQHHRRGRIGDLLVALARHPLPIVARVVGTLREQINAYIAAGWSFVDDLIDPAETRSAIIGVSRWGRQRRWSARGANTACCQCEPELCRVRAPKAGNTIQSPGASGVGSHD
jgi:enoyl-CoA hydratase/isomerase-like protein